MTVLNATIIKDKQNKQKGKSLVLENLNDVDTNRINMGSFVAILYIIGVLLKLESK